MNESRICITGAAGFIGSHLTDRLLSLGNKVTGLDNFNDFYPDRAKRQNLSNALKNENFTLLKGDIRSKEDLKKALSGCNSVIHLAALAGVRPSMKDPILYQDVNAGGTLQLLEASKEAGLTNVIFASSSSIYGNNKKTPFSESDPVDHPISVYAATKKAGELLCHSYHALYDLDITCLRFFTVFGPRQRPDLAIHKFSRRILEDQPIPVFGDGTMKRDHTYIDDIVNGVTAAIETNPGKGFRIINLGSDRPVSLSNLISAIETALGKKATIERLSIPPSDVKRTWADLTKAKQELGYSPKTTLEQGLASFVAWLKETQLST